MSKEKYTLYPVRDLLIVELDSAEETTKGGIIIPDVAKDKKRIGTILRRGDNCDKAYQIGTKVLISEFSGENITLNVDGKDLNVKILPEEDIQALAVAV